MMYGVLRSFVVLGRATLHTTVACVESSRKLNDRHSLFFASTQLNVSSSVLEILRFTRTFSSLLVGERMIKIIEKR